MKIKMKMTNLGQGGLAAQHLCLQLSFGDDFSVGVRVGTDIVAGLGRRDLHLRRLRWRGLLLMVS